MLSSKAINSTILLLKNSDTLNVDLNAKDHEGGTAFHYACSNGQLKLAKLLMKNSIEFNIELEHIDNDGRLVSNSDYPMNNVMLILLRERPLMTSNIRVGRGSTIAPKVGRYRVGQGR